MNLEDFEFADSKTVGISFNNNDKIIEISFDSVFDLLANKWVNATLIISGWKQLSIYKYIPYDISASQVYDKVHIEIESPEFFSLIQIVKKSEDKLFLEGYSKDSSCWLVYEFTNCLFQIILPK